MKLGDFLSSVLGNHNIDIDVPEPTPEPTPAPAPNPAPAPAPTPDTNPQNLPSTPPIKEEDNKPITMEEFNALKKQLEDAQSANRILLYGGSHRVQPQTDQEIVADLMTRRNRNSGRNLEEQHTDAGNRVPFGSRNR